MNANSRWNVKWVLAVGILAGAFALLMAGSASATQSGSTYTSGSGNWAVTTPTVVQNEVVDVNGIITVSSTFDLMNVTIRFTVTNGGIVIAAPSGGMTMIPGAGGVALITTTNTSNYFTFVIQNTTNSVVIENATIDQVVGGIVITGGTAQSRYFAHVTVTHAKLYGWVLTDSWATLFNINTTLEFAPNIIHRDWDNRNYVSNKAGTTGCPGNSSYNYSAGSYYYGYNYIYRCINDFWSATGTGYLVTRGGPTFDGLDVHIPAGGMRIDADLLGSSTGWYNYSYYPSYNSVCYQSGLMPPHYWYAWNYTYHYFQFYLSYNGTVATNSQFARFKDVHTPPEDIYVDLHYDLLGTYYYYQDFCGAQPTYIYSFPDSAYSYNRIDVAQAEVVGIKVIDGGIGDNFNNLNLSMGKAGVSYTSDWAGSPQYQLYFLQSYASFAAPSVYSFWSSETYTIASAQAVTRTDFGLRNSIATGAGMRFDRVWNYNVASQPAGAADTVFRGVVAVDNVTVMNVAGVGLDIRILANATQTPDTMNYTASITNSYFQAKRGLSLNMTNQLWYASNYVNSILVENNVFVDGNVTPPSFPQTGSNTQPPIFSDSHLAIDTGYHHTALAGDTYKADVVVRGNTFQNITGPVFGWSYSDYIYAGGSTLRFENNTFRQIKFYTSVASQVPSQSDAMFKTIADQIAFIGNVFDDVYVGMGLIGGQTGPYPTAPYYAYAICQYYLPTYGYHYWYYGCSFPMKTPKFTVESNTFNNVRTFSGGQIEYAFFVMPGHAKMVFNNNTITGSQALFVYAFSNFYPASTTYQFLVADLDLRIQGNTIRGQSGLVPFIYTDPYKAGNPVQILNNDYRDSFTPLFTWKWTYYPGLSASYRPVENLATMIISGNVIKNVTAAALPIFGLTGRATISNNSFENVNAWALKVEYMTKVPVLSSTNRLVNVTNGYWISPISSGGTLQTTTLTNLTIIVTSTAIRWENGNLILSNANFGAATNPLHMVNGHADVFSSNIPVLSATVAQGGSVSVYNLVGFSVHWASAQGVDSGVTVGNAALVISSSAHKILTSGRADANGTVAPKMTLVWEEYSFGASAEGKVYAPFEILVSSQGVSQTVKLPDLGPGEVPTHFQDYPSFLVLLRDTMVPTISVGTPTAGSTLGRQDIAVEGHSFERGSGIAEQMIKLDNQDWVNIPVSGVATWTLELLADSEGLHTIFGEVSDRAGNSYQIEVPFYIDITPPSLDVTDPIAQYTNTREPTYIVQGHVEPASSLVDINGVSVPVLGRGEFAFEFTLLDGLNVLFITAEDSAGNEVTVVRRVYFDQYAPFIQVTSPVDGLKTGRSVIDVEGRAEPGATVTVNGIPAVASPLDGSFIIRNFVLADLYVQTDNLLMIRAIDQVGNTAWDNRTVTVDIRAPTITFELADQNIWARIQNGQPIAASSLDIRGKTDTADAIVTVSGQVVPLALSTFSRVIVLAEGRNAVEVAAEDEVGNVNRVTLVIWRDTAQPSLTIDRPAEHTVLTNQRTLEIRGWTDAPGATVYLEYNNSVGVAIVDALPAVPVGNPITYRFERLLDLVSDGNVHEVTVRVVDAAGNFATDTIVYTSKVTPPSVTLLNLADTTTESFVWVNGSTDAGITKVRINGQVFDVNARFFSVRWNLPVTSGDYTFRVSVVDLAGNVGETQGTVHVNVARPGGTQTVSPTGVSPQVLTGAMFGLLGVAVAVLFVGYSHSKRKQE